MRGLRAKGVTSQAELDRLQAEAQQATARAGEIRATIERKRIRAPFSGTLGIRQVNLGQYLNGGDPVVPLQTLDPDPSQLHGAPTAAERRGGRSRSGGDRGGPGGHGERQDHRRRFGGRSGDAQRPGPGDLRQRAGNRCVRVCSSRPRSSSAPREKAIALPASAINYAPYGDSVFVVEDVTGPDGKTYRGVRQQVVKLGAARGDQVAVISGLKPGEEVVTSGVFKLRPGAAVVGQQRDQPSNSATPTPEDS